MNDDLGALPLEGLSVVELHAIGPVPFAGLKLLELGASVVRVSPIGGRAVGIDLPIETDLLNRGKRLCEIDLKQGAGIDELHSLLSGADVLLEGFRPGVLERLGLSPDQLLGTNPSLVIGRLSGFGRHGPWAARAGHDINYLALAGVLAAIGTQDNPAVPLNLIGDFGGGAMHLVMGVLAKLVQRGITGCGGVVDTSILAGTLGLTPMLHGLIAGGLWTVAREQNLLDGHLPFYRVYRTLDNQFVAVGALESPFFKALLELTGLASVIDASRQYDEDTWPAMQQSFASAFAQRTRDGWAADAQSIDCCVTPVLTMIEACAYAPNRVNGWICDVPFAHPCSLIDFDSM